jgi:hypothetical protein
MLVTQVAIPTVPVGAQFTVNGDRNLLATAEAGVGRILQHAAEPPPKELWDSPIPPDEANFGLEVPF